jgi:transposase
MKYIKKIASIFYLNFFGLKKMRRTTDKVIKEIIKCRAFGMSISETAKRWKVSDFTVKKYTHKVPPKKGRRSGGRPNRFSDEVSSFLLEQFRANKCKNLVDGKVVLKEKFNVEVSKQTVRNCLLRNGLKCFIKQKKPFLSPVHKEKRYNFAEKYLEYNYQDWMNIIWTDECNYLLKNPNKVEYYWKKRSKPLNKDHIKKTKKFDGGLVMVWACLTAKGPEKSLD